MKDALRVAALCLLGPVVLAVGAFGFGIGWLEWRRYFAPKHENVRREVFEETQSYVHGKIQDLAKYKDEYDRSETVEGKEAIRQLVILRFAEFDETKVKASGLRSWLVTTRGY